MLFGSYVPPRLWDDEVVKPAPQYAKSWRICKFPDIGDLQSIRYGLSCVAGVEVIFDSLVKSDGEGIGSEG